MNTAPAIAPPPVRRRNLQMPTEPLLFAAMLTVLTLGINVGPPKAEAAQEQAAVGKAAKASNSVNAANARAPAKAAAAR